MPDSKPLPEDNRQRRKDERAGEILNAALDEFHARGYSAVTISDIARSAGVAPGTLYLYFANKEELFKAVVRELVLPNITRLEEAAEGTRSGRERLRAVLQAWAELMFCGRGSMVKLVIAEAGNFPELARFYREEVGDRVRLLFGRIVEEGVASGEFRPCDVATVVRLMTSPLIMANLWRHTFPDSEHVVDGPAIVDPLLDIVLQGIARNPESFA